MTTGKILVYSKDASAGIIQCEKTTHYFHISQWLSPGIAPASNLPVIFDEGYDGAKNVKAADGR